jgi:hypothetical protein
VYAEDGDEDIKGDSSVLEQEDGWMRYNVLYCETRIQRLKWVGRTIIKDIKPPHILEHKEHRRQ